jgi:hypothetical protein
VLQEKDALLARAADEVAAIKAQAKAAAAKFSERAKSEKAELQAEVKRLQVSMFPISLSLHL